MVQGIFLSHVKTNYNKYSNVNLCNQQLTGESSYKLKLLVSHTPILKIACSVGGKIFFLYNK